MKQRHQGEDYPGHQKICFPVHEHATYIKDRTPHFTVALED
jgi:hypothetical protein